MNQLKKEEIIQAIVIADNFNDCLVPFTDRNPLSLLPVANVPLLDYALETLNRSGVEEVFLFCGNHLNVVKEYVKAQKDAHCSWSIGMTVSIVGSEGCRCLGDALRDVDAKGLVRGDFILTGVDTVTNANFAAILEEHKRVQKSDKGAVMTVVFKEGAAHQRTENEVMIAMDRTTNRLLFHQRLKSQSKERNFTIPLETFLLNKHVSLKHGLIDPQIAICSNAALPLFSDNFDFLTRDDFVRGLLINEEILASTIYVSMLPRQEYAMKVSNWQSFQITSKDVANRYVYPLVLDMGVCGNSQMYSFCRNNIYRHKDIRLARESFLDSDVVIGKLSEIDANTFVSHSVLGKGVKIGKNCRITNSFLMDGVEIGDNCQLDLCVLSERVKVGLGSKLTNGCILGQDVILPKGTEISKLTLQSMKPDDDWSEGIECISEFAYTVPDSTENPDNTLLESDDEGDTNAFNHAMRLSKLERTHAPSVYSSSSEDGDSRAISPIQEDAHIFFSEVLESLKRGYTEKSNAEYLILEINSSRYAYNMALAEVNFYVVKALLQLLTMQENAVNNTIATLNQLLSYFGPVFKNYIRGRDAMMDCLKALQETCSQEELIQAKMAQLIHCLYEKDYLTEDVILEWHAELDETEEGTLKKSLTKLVDWLMQSSEEDDDDDSE
ncbi:translation initiation factor eIF-2B subunit epsilon [Toxorhynchites rutilus septentrionalis]|uniref:translation initiation factor eIF-2B subunit epsilon n=1 Tax=Toxorhynchites rutilus septentrionalis TaxID=329112 RepID=UPI0024784A47|nr:translation initiation factor eIF-2B subunit epsilon [Toxorhynchites rutilus septentrionalis]